MSTSLLKQYGNLVKNVRNFTDGQVKISEETTATNGQDSLELISLTFSPTGGLYRGGTFTFTITMNNFPQEAPEVMCVTQIYHPNIDVEGEVCLNLLDDLWNSSTTLEDVVQGILFLFYSPNVDDPLSELFDGSEPYKLYRKNVRKSLKGGTVANFPFERNLPEDFIDEEKEEEEEEKTEEEKEEESKRLYHGSEDEIECSDSEDSSSNISSDVVYDSLDDLQNHETESNYSETSEELANLGSSLVHHRISFVLLTPVRLFKYIIGLVDRVFNLFTFRYSFWTFLWSYRTLNAHASR